MRIGYVAKHDSGGNDDEGAIFYALENLGHRVERLRESRGEVAHKLDCDFVLFHHWTDTSAMSRIKVPRVFWCFDLVTYPDPTLRQRNERRIGWMNSVTHLVDVGFCTDGDWVAQDTTGKLVWLPQGADERYVGRGELSVTQSPPILFTGTHRGGGAGREAFVRHLESRWAGKYRQITGVHGRNLADQIANSRVCVAPNHPATDRYWSNRTYLTSGFGGCLLHPKCEKLMEHYAPSLEIVMYDGLEEFDDRLGQLLNDPVMTRDIGDAACQRTVKEHLYRHRVEKLIQTVQERCF